MSRFMRNNIIFLLIITFARILCADIDKHQNNHPINITASELIIEQKKNMAIFRGNVTAIKENLIINSDIMEIEYSNNKNKTEKNQKFGKITKIIAKKNVKLKNQEKIATSDQASYDLKNNLIILTGNAMLRQENSMISGEKIIYNIENEDIQILNDKQNNKVRAIISY